MLANYWWSSQIGGGITQLFLEVSGFRKLAENRGESIVGGRGMLLFTSEGDISGLLLADVQRKRSEQCRSQNGHPCLWVHSGADVAQMWATPAHRPRSPPGRTCAVRAATSGPARLSKARDLPAAVGQSSLVGNATRGKFRRPWFPPTEKKADKCSLRVVRKSTARVQPSCPPPLSAGLHPAALTALLGDGRLDGDTALKERRVPLQGLHEVAVVAGEGDGP